MIINITNPEAIGTWLQQMSAGEDDIAQWLQKAFSQSLMWETARFHRIRSVTPRRCIFFSQASISQ